MERPNAEHMDGWNGKICRDPASNHYCIGPHSYPGDKIKIGRDLEWETKFAGQSCDKLDQAPPCIYSINAFGTEALTGFDDPPSFFKTGDRAHWPLPPATVCVWPYEAMYNDEAKTEVCWNSKAGCAIVAVAGPGDLCSRVSDLVLVIPLNDGVHLTPAFVNQWLFS